ncbi:hypothetical protein [Agromyces indicus]|uniref:DUF3618 domain-containing protein n=1 Tax=Agromyces indicus TaxID=758919 RepID=A0ABU1FNF9_9MICO|nr:hypothetical protein [Agromyces indicus]MDR5692936.1 hypothetical protein [Agromyces indicus]
MSDEKTTRTDAGASGTEDSTTMPPTTPIGSESVTGTTASGSTGSGSTGTSGSTAAPAGPGEDVDSGDREAVDSVGAPSGTPLGKATDAAAEAARTAAAKLREAADSADLDKFAEDAKRVTGEWSEKVKEEYRRRPGVVIGAAVAGLVVLGTIARALGRRR